MQQGWIKIVHECDLSDANGSIGVTKARPGSVWRCYCSNLWKLVKIEGDQAFWDDEFPEEKELRERVGL